MRKIVVLIAILASLAALAAVPVQRVTPAAEGRFTAAEALVEEGSWGLALEKYQAIDLDGLTPEQQRWVLFRRADLQWRAAPEDRDQTPVQEAERTLQKLLTDSDGKPIDDPVRPEILESLGDLQRSARRRNFGGAWQFYSQALDWWAGSRNVDLARERYLRIIRKATTDQADQGWAPRGYWASSIPLEVLDNALKIAKDPADRVLVNYLIALNLSNRNDPASIERTRTSFEAAIAPEVKTDWRDDALYFYAQWLSRTGHLEFTDEGGFSATPDWDRAVEVYRTLVSEYSKGQSRWRDEAEQQLKIITEPSLALGVGDVFLPGSEIRFGLAWRNLHTVGFTLTSVDLIRDIHLEEQGDLSNWIEKVEPRAGARTVRWTRTLDVPRRYAPGRDEIRVAEKLSPGAWLLEARSGSTTTRDLILVTDLAIATRTSSDGILAWAVDARTGEPRDSATLADWTSIYRNGSHRILHHSATTDHDGVAMLEFDPGVSGQGLLVGQWKDRQAVVPFWGYRTSRSGDEPWRIYAFTDRPAYRPDETVHWKLTARTESSEGYRVPAGVRLRWKILDPRGSEAGNGEIRLNSFGSGWADLALNSSMPLGPYRIVFETADGRRVVGQAELFRLEEYKLPEFRVEVKTEDSAGNPRLYRLGDRVEATVDASYYFGGPVANATVEVIVRQQPYARWWMPERRYDWYFDQQPQRWRGNGEEVERVTLMTGPDGRATVAFDTPAAANQDYEYTIEARVTDASRREIAASKTIRVTRAPYAAEARPEHYLYRPGDPIEVTFKAVDANDQPAAATGTVRITRERWHEVWLDPAGNRISGDALEAVRARIGVFPPPPEPGHHPWTALERGYLQEEIRTESFTTDSTGRAVVRFTADHEGYYRFAFTSRPVGLVSPRPRDVVEAETTAWVTSVAASRIGYHHEGGVEMILDQESVRAGRTVPVMIVAPSSGRDVLFTVETDSILSHQRLHMSGNVKLVEVKLGDEHIPNIFLASTMVADSEIFQDQKELVVPPVEKFLDITITPGQEEYRPRDAGRFDLMVRDVDGNPVATELALGVADESVYTISEDPAGDPRQVFYGQKRGHGVRLDSSFEFHPYRRYVERDGEIVDERFAARDLRRNEVEAKDEIQNQVGGGYAEGMVGAMPPPAPAPMAQSITVTAESPAMKSAAREMAVSDAAATPAGGEVIVRSDFRSTVFWQPDIVTGPDGKASVDVTFPDSLTTWRATARGVTSASQMGIATASVRTKKPLIVRLQAPRFFVVGDEVMISAVINNNTDRPLTASPGIDVAGLDLVAAVAGGRRTDASAGPVKIEPNGETRIDWIVSAREPGEARLRVSARADALNDAMEKSFPVEDHGIDVLVATGGKVRGSEAAMKLEIPAERRKDSTTLTVQVTPSMAVTMLDAMPYLIDYPYGCTEQTMSRFLPTVVVAKTLADLGVSRTTVAGRLFGGIEPGTADKTHGKGKQDLAKMDDMVRAGLNRLYDFQHGDGGWGWWKEGDSDRFMSAYVVWGMALARDAGTDIRSDVLDRGVQYLAQQLVQEESSPERQSWMLQALSAARGTAPGSLERKAFDNAFGRRDAMSAYGVALLALAAHQYGLNDQAQILARNLENGVVLDRKPDQSILVRGSGSGSDTVMGTAHWGSDGSWWRWYQGPIESTAFALRALSAIDPDHRLIEPAMNWLVKNRRGAQWSNTRDTAIAILALNEYLRTSGELRNGVSYEVLVNGRSVAKKSIAAGQAISAPSRFTVPSELIRDGANEVVVRRTAGDGALYISAEARFFSREEPVRARGNELFVKRQYFRLEPHPTLLKGFQYDRVPIEDGGTVASGDRIEVVVTLDAKNDYEYLLIEDLKPAGFEAVEVQSGQSLMARRLAAPEAEEKHGGAGVMRKAAGVRPPGNGWIDSRSVYQELRDRKIAMFIDQLGQGIWEIRYTLRAEVPGTFHALPVIGQAMYVPEIRGNGDEVRVTVEQ